MAVIYHFTKRQNQPGKVADKVVSKLKAAGLKPHIISQPDGTIMVRTEGVSPELEAELDKLTGSTNQWAESFTERSPIDRPGIKRDRI